MRRTSLAPAGFLISRIETGLPATSTVSTRPNAAFADASPATAVASGTSSRIAAASAASAL